MILKAVSVYVCYSMKHHQNIIFHEWFCWKNASVNNLVRLCKYKLKSLHKPKMPEHNPTAWVVATFQ